MSGRPPRKSLFTRSAFTRAAAAGAALLLIAALVPAAILLPVPPSAAAEESVPVMVVLDASGSMMQDDAPGPADRRRQVRGEKPHRRGPGFRPDGADGLRHRHRLRAV